MRIKSKGYSYKGYHLGQKVMYKGKEEMIIGFDTTAGDEEFIAITMNSSLRKVGFELIKSVYADVILGGYDEKADWVWVSPSEIEVIQEPEENVLSIKVTQINDKYSTIEIIHQNIEVLKRGEFNDTQINISSCISPDYEAYVLYVKGIDSSKDDKPFIVDNKYVAEIEEKVRLINEKYGIPKRWRAEKNCLYYYISDCMNIICSEETYDWTSQARYERGNYFRTEYEAEKALSKINQIPGDDGQ